MAISSPSQHGTQLPAGFLSQRSHLHLLSNASLRFSVHAHVCAQLCLTLCDPMESSLPGSSVHRISQARILDWVAISSSKWSTWLRDQTRASCVSCIGRQIFKSLSHLESPRFSILLLIYVCVSHIFIGKLCNIRSNIQGLWNACIHSDSPPVGECVVWREHTSLCQLGF